MTAREELAYSIISCQTEMLDFHCVNSAKYMQGTIVINTLLANDIAFSRNTGYLTASTD